MGPRKLYDNFRVYITKLLEKKKFYEFVKKNSIQSTLISVDDTYIYILYYYYNIRTGTR